MTRPRPLAERIHRNRQTIARRLRKIGFDVHDVDGNPLFNLIVTGLTDAGEIYTFRVRVIVLSEVITLEELDAQAEAYPQSLIVAANVESVLGWYGLTDEK